MSDKESAKNVIDAYQRRQQRSQRAPIMLAIAAFLLIVGAAVIIFWVMGNDKPFLGILATQTSTPTITATATATATNTATPTNTATELPPTDTPTVTATATPSGPSIYVVAENDNLSSIAAKFNTDLATLLALNPQIDPKTLIIRLGDQVIIPAPNTQLPTATPVPPDLARGTIIEYVIVPGDTLEALALSFNSTLDAILTANKEIENANDIRVGDIIKIPVNLVTPVPTATQGTILPTIAAPDAATATPQP